MRVIVSFDRRFQCWQYTVGHAMLLLRSTPEVEGESQVDVLFTDVAYVRLPTLLDGFEVTPGGASDLGDDQVSLEHHRVFRVRCRGVSGVVVAGEVHAEEWQGTYGDPSPLLSWPLPTPAPLPEQAQRILQQIQRFAAVAMRNLTHEAPGESGLLRALSPDPRESDRKLTAWAQLCFDLSNLQLGGVASDPIEWFVKQAAAKFLASYSSPGEIDYMLVADLLKELEALVGQGLDRAS